MNTALDLPGELRTCVVCGGPLIQRSGEARRDEESAARAYDDAARKHYGALARLNFPEDGEQSALNTEGRS